MRKSRRGSAADPVPTAPNNNFAWMYQPAYLPGGTTTGGSPPPPPPAMPPPMAPPMPPPSGWAPTMWAPPTSRKGPRAAIIVGAVSVVVLVLVGAAVLVVNRQTPSVSLPDHVAGLSVLNNPGTQAEINDLDQQMHGLGSRHVTARVYTADGLTVAASAFAGDLPLNDQNQGNVEQNFVGGFVTSFTAGSSSQVATEVSPGSNGGYMACGLRTFSSDSLSFCVWSDGHTFSVVTDTHGTADGAHALALEIRAADGH